MTQTDPIGWRLKTMIAQDHLRYKPDNAQRIGELYADDRAADTLGKLGIEVTRLSPRQIAKNKLFDVSEYPNRVTLLGDRGVQRGMNEQDFYMAVIAMKKLPLQQAKERSGFAIG